MLNLMKLKVFSGLNNIFDEEINPSERKEYDNVSNFCY